MAPFTFSAEFESGRRMELVPNYVYPLELADIRKLEINDKSALKIQLEAKDVFIDGQHQVGRMTMQAKVTFSKPTTIFSLVLGGWLPMPFVIPARFLVDRNVVISLRKIRESKVAANADALLWWTKLFEGGSGIFNPLPFAYEAGFRRKPTFSEFVSAYDEGRWELLDALPNCHIVKFDDAHYRAAYTQLEAFDFRNERELSFLIETCPLVAQRVSRRDEAEVVKFILYAANKYGVSRTSFSVLAILSCLYENVQGILPSIGRQILKPKPTYSEANAFNALSDLRHIELTAICQAVFKEEAFSLCTCDRAIPLFWSSLSPRGQSSSGGEVELSFDLTSELFPRLCDDEIFGLRKLLIA